MRWVSLDAYLTGPYVRSMQFRRETDGSKWKPNPARQGETKDSGGRNTFWISLEYPAAFCSSMIGSMKSKTSITLSTTLLEEIDKIVGRNGSRSELIEKAVHEYIHKIARAQRDQRDLEILNRSAKRMNREAEDVLRYQVKL